MLELYEGALNAKSIYESWYEKFRDKNCGAFVSFTGIVRDEDGIDGLSFDIYEPILNNWFNEWQKKLNKLDSYLLMAHSIGDVPNHATSFMATVVSPKRRVGLEMLDLFVEDFKAKAPIWKYDLKNKKRVYAKERSKALPNAGLLAQ